MPEIKNQFTGGKMNKDVDERLVPKGEYRDAMNIQVSTSEGSDVGTVQNILGNSAVLADLGIDSGSMCVGAVADEKNDALYWFMKEPSSAYNLTVSQSRDIIFELKSGNVQHVFVDIKSISIAVDTLQAPASGDIVINSQTGFNAINIGDTFQLFANGVNLSGTEFYTVLSKNQGALSINIGDYTNASWANYQAGAAGELQITLNTGGGVLKFPSKIITGINIIDDMLFWTDGVTEPKKINIPRSIAGTASGNFHTRLINLDQNITYGDNILTQEEHITTVRKSPLKPPKLSQLSSVRSGTVSGVTANLDFADSNGELFNEGDPVDIDILDDSSGSAPNLQIGDTLRLLESGVANLPPEDYTARVVIDNIISGTGLTTYKTTISTLSSENPIGAITYEFALEEEGNELFERKFPRFAYRYKYADNEYSAIGPFSEVAFVPGNFSYHPTEAYNKGMVNNLKKLTLEGFIPTDIPKDVIQVDLLYKNETNPSVYVIKSIVKGDAAWNFGGSYDVLTENIQALLPSNQLLRPWDNVPKSALAQEVTGNRIVYGNYTQGYDYSISKALYSPEIQASIGGRPNREGYNTTKSIKSLRTYDFGVVYGDEYGRETPVLTASSATQVVPKSFSSNSNSINISLDENPPLWADYCKVFVKETSNEYYNLAVDRVYDAEDGNVWLSFPSVDRNKIDEDTYIVLKKGIDNSEAVLEEARYKVVAIENEAPDYIKTSYTLISEPNQTINGFNLFGGNGVASPTVQSPAEAPWVGHTSFTVNKNLWTSPYNAASPYGMGLVNLAEFMSELQGDDLYVAFSTRVVDDPDGGGLGIATYTKRVSGKHLIVGISDDGTTGNTSTNNTGGAELFEVHLDKPIPQSEDWLTTSIEENYANGGQLQPHFYRQRVINKPEFDGRFFVKIIEDEAIGNKVKPIDNIGLDWKVVASEPLYYLLDEDADSTSSNGNTGYGASKTEAHWKNNLKFGGSSVKDKWFIDKASYAGTQPGGSNNISNSTSNDGGGTSWVNNTTADSYLAVYKYYDDPNGSELTAYRTWSWNGTGMSLGVVFSDGLFTDSSNDTYFHLSYSQLKSNPNTQSLNDNWNVGNSDNSHTEDQNHVTSNLKTGNYFRIRGDETVYIITGSYTERLYNYMGHIPFTKTNDQVEDAFCVHPQYNYASCYAINSSLSDNPYYDFLSEMTSHHNKRLRYTIKYEVFDGATALASNPELQLINNTTPGALEFVEPFQAERPNVISSNPAIFETEPKEDTDLDIYYETANSVLLNFTIANREQFIPPGATLDFEDANYLINNSIPEDLHVVGWGPSVNWSNATAVVEASVVLSHEIPIGSIPSTLKFVRPDGSWVEAVITGAPTTAGNAGIVAFNIDSFTKNIGLAWFNCWSFNNGVESNRIGDTYNKPFVTNGVKVSTPLLDQYKEEHRKYGLIYSGIYNSTSGVNNLNQFIAAEKITKDINPTYGSIQKLHSGWGQGGDLVALCEDRILKILANKDALFNADGNTNVTSTNNVLGQAIPYSGEYGISKNPESFASEAYRIYFTDKVRGTVMRLSMDGLTPISNHGMKDWFRDNLKLNNTILGSYDDKKDEYNVTLQQTDDAKRNNNPVTISFREDVKGWVSFKSFTPENAISCANEYYTFKNAKIWKHHDESVGRNTFYDAHPSSNWSTLNVILNDIPGSVKSFNTINYEGSQSRVETNFQDNQYYNLTSKPGWFVDSIFTNKESGSLNEFIEKEGKWFNYIRGEEVQHSGSNIIVNPDGSSSFDQASFAIQGLGILGAEPIDDPFIYGCMDPTAFNYNPSATASDNSCIPVIYGCMEETASNTCNNNCNTENGNCQWTGCCCEPQFFPNGCTNEDGFSEALAYDAIWGAYSNQTLIVCDTTCIGTVEGCTNPLATNYDALANTDDGSCVVPIYGCMEDTADFGYDITATDENGECIWYGCLDATAENYGTNFHADSDPALYTPASASFGQVHDVDTCTYTDGCMDAFADNWDPNADNPDGSCTYCADWADGELYGGVQGYSTPSYGVTITNETYQGYDDGTIEISIPSGTFPADFVGIWLWGDYNGPANNSSGPYYAITAGVTTAVFTGVPPGDYYFQATQGSSAMVGDQANPCVFDSYASGMGVYQMTVMPGPDPNGCTDATACNYDPLAIIDDGSCVYAGCGDPQAINFGNVGYQEGCGCTAGDTSCCTYAPLPVLGCTDDGSGALVSAMYPGIAACNYDSNANTDDGSCTYTSCAGCLDDRQNNAQTGYASSTYDDTKTIHDQSQCVYNYGTVVYDGNTGGNNTTNFIPESMSTILSGPLAAHNFRGNDSTSPNWTDELIGSGVNGATIASAVFDVSNAPPIRFPGYGATGVSTPNQTSTRETRFSWEMPGHTSDWSSGVTGDITTYYGFSTAPSATVLEWSYSNDNGTTWLDGPTNYAYGSEVRLVKFYMYVSDDESSGRLDWGTYPNGYDGKIYQNAKFGFTDLVWNGNSIPLNDDGACAGGSSCPDFHVIEESESKTITTGCMQQSYCNTSGTANWPTDSTNNPCAGTPGCLTSGSCNYNASADCSAPCTSPTTWYYYELNWTCGGSAPGSGCYGLNVCQVNGTCRGTAYSSPSQCENANCTGLVGCTDPTACNYDAAAVCDDGTQCLPSIQCPDQADSGTGYNCGSSGCYQPTTCGFIPNTTTYVGCGIYTGVNAASDCATNCISPGD
jgi:hypothetical protein